MNVRFHSHPFPRSIQSFPPLLYNKLLNPFTGWGLELSWQENSAVTPGFFRKNSCLSFITMYTKCRSMNGWWSCEALGHQPLWRHLILSPSFIIIMMCVIKKRCCNCSCNVLILSSGAASTEKLFRQPHSPVNTFTSFLLHMHIFFY